MKRHSLRFLAAGAIVGVLAGTSAAAHATQPRWQDVPRGSIDDQTILSAAGRVWFLRGTGTAKSARVVNGRLGAWTFVTGINRPWLLEGLLGDDLIYETVSSGGSVADPKTLRVIRLFPNGHLSEPAEVGGAPASPYAAGIRAFPATAAIRLPDRAVELVNAQPQAQLPHVGVCCDLNGEAQDYSSFIVPASRPIASLGLDRHGRLWLAWEPYRAGKTKALQAQIVGIDPRTLAPLGKPLSIRGVLGVARIRSLVCAEICRLVVQAVLRSGSGEVSWAPGEPSATRLALPGTDTAVIRAFDDGGHLAVAYRSQDAKGAVTVGLARGDRRGGHLRLLGSIPYPISLGGRRNPAPSIAGPFGAFGPAGFAAAGVYQTIDGSRDYARVAILPLP